MVRGRGLVVVLVLLPACGGGSGHEQPQSLDAAPVGDSAPPGVDVAPGDRRPAGPPAVTRVSFPDGAAGVIPMAVSIADGTSRPVRLTVEVSLDGRFWKTASIAGAPLTLPSSPAGAVSTVVWDSVKDVGFHVPRSAKLRLTPSTETETGAALLIDTPVLHNTRAAGRMVDRYMITYGHLTPEVLATAKRYDLVIVHPSREEIDRDAISALQAGLDPDDPADDVLVLAYVSVGEDLRTGGLGDGEIRSDPRFVGDGTGPRVDPRGPGAGGQPLQGIDPRGAPSPGGKGFASFYLDDNSLQLDGRADGIPDRNRFFDCYFVNAGDPSWYPVIDRMTLAADGLAGLHEVMGTDLGRGLGCDGVFLDTIDTAAPNFYTDASSPNPGRFEWTAPGFSTFIARIHDSYPDKLVLQNRGVFFFDPRLPHYEHTTRGAIDFAFFESYRLDSSLSREYDAGFYGDNRNNVAPKLMAEANRSDGFRVLSLGYAKNIGSMATATLVGQSTLGLSTLLEDIRVTQELAGFRHYISDPPVKLVSSFVLDHSSLEDHLPPVWTSSYNDNASPWPGTEPTPRVGIQDALTGAAAGQILVRWDVAMDMHPVRYALYHATAPFDFAGDPSLTAATRVVLDPVAPASYRKGVGPGVYANEAVVAGLQPGRTYHLLVRAFDLSPAANEETNTVVLTATAAQ